RRPLKAETGVQISSPTPIHMERIRFFLAEFHGGAVNQVAHFTAFGLLAFGAAQDNLLFVLSSGVLMMLGNLYNYAAGRNRSEFWRTLHLQAAGWLFAVLIAYAFSLIVS
ncbi:MAG: hypothetical protein Q8P12_04970, partial [bacterium]|nr:hypothetical protein [bacterium]